MGIVTAIIMGLISWFVANFDKDTVLIYFDVFGVLVLWFYGFCSIEKSQKI